MGFGVSPIYFWRNTMSDLKKYAVTYTIDYHHRVVVGVAASDSDAAIKMASNAFDEGAIWDNTPEMPLLFDDYEEKEGESLCFFSEEVSEFPEPDSSVKELQKREFAFYACQALLAGEVSAARDFARKALPHVVESHPAETTWVAQSDNGCDPFEVIAAGLEDALRDALHAIGWTVSSKQDDPDAGDSDDSSESDEPHVSSDVLLETEGYVGSNESQLLTSIQILDIAKDHDLELSMFSDNGFRVTHFLGAENKGHYSHEGCDGDTSRITAKDFLRAYPNSLGKIWHVDQKIHNTPQHHGISRFFRNMIAAIYRSAGCNPLVYLI
jgi:hypothetical protein